MRRFSSDGKRIHVFDRQTRAFWKTVPRSVAAQRDFNIVTRQDGTRDPWPEQKLAEFDDAAAKLLPKLVNGAELTRNERWTIAWFAAFCDTRGLGFRVAVQNELRENPVDWPPPSGFLDERFVEAYATAKGIWLDQWILERLMVEEAASVRSGGHEIGSMAAATFELARHLFYMQWLIATAPEGASFITTDRPLAFLHRDSGIPGGDPLEPSTLKVFPLAPTMALIIGNIADELNIQRAVIPERVVRLSNVALARRFDRYLIASSEKLLRAVVADAELVNM